MGQLISMYGRRPRIKKKHTYCTRREVGHVVRIFALGGCDREGGSRRYSDGDFGAVGGVGVVEGATELGGKKVDFW